MIEADTRVSTPRTDSSSLSRRKTLAGLAVLPALIPAVAAAADPDPIFAAIERHRVLSTEYDSAVAISGNLGGPEFEAAEEITSVCCDALLEHANKLICSKPTTLAGAIALVRYVASLEEWQEPVDYDQQAWEDAGELRPKNWHHTFLDTLADALDKMAAPGRTA